MGRTLSWGDHVLQRDLDQLGDELAKVRHAEARIREQVAYLRQQETPWSVIGDALGITKQAAQQRYSSQRVSLNDRPFPGA
ncbi:hypothetical protein [Nocardioides sp. HB32]